MENQSEQPGNLYGQKQKASELEVEHKTHLTAKELSSLWSTTCTILVFPVLLSIFSEC